MILSPEVKALCDRFFSETTENNEVYFVKWTFPDAQMPDLSLEKAQKDYDLAEITRKTVDSMIPACTLHTDEIMLKVLRYYCGYIQNNYLNYWQKFDLNHYTCPIPTFLEKFLKLPLDTPEQQKFYIRVLENFIPFIGAMDKKLRTQAKMYIRMPVEGCKLVLTSMKICLDMTQQAADRLPEAVSFCEKIAESLRKIMDYVGGDYMAHAPQTIGMGQYPGGPELYARQIMTYISCNAAPEEIQQKGYRALADTEAEMLKIARSLGFEGTLAEFSRSVQNDPRFRFKTPEEMQTVMTGFLDKIRPLMPKYFNRMPKADCAVARIDPAMESTTSWGYYNIPVEKPVGVYYYSAAELDQRCQVRTNAVVYHELLPGHHYQMNLVLEDDTLPEIIHHHYNTACADGWAEYASGFCRELGLYTPYADFGRLSWDAFLCCRLIVDTGLNALGWTYEEARDFLKQHTMFTDSEIYTELLRYTIGMPAQALSYKWGSLKFNEMRRRAEKTLGSRFDLREFHDVMLEFGSVPLNIVEEHFEWYLRQKEGEPV